MPRRRKLHDKLPDFAVERLERQSELLNVEIRNSLGWLMISTPHHDALLAWMAATRRALNIINDRHPEARQVDGGPFSGPAKWIAPTGDDAAG